MVTRRYGFSRETRDLDVLAITPNTQREAFLRKGAEGSELHKKYKVYLDFVNVLDAYPETMKSASQRCFLVSSNAFGFLPLKPTTWR